MYVLLLSQGYSQSEKVEVPHLLWQEGSSLLKVSGSHALQALRIKFERSFFAGPEPVALGLHLQRMAQSAEVIRGVTSADAHEVQVTSAEKPVREEVGCWKRAYAATTCAFVASTGFFHGYDNGVVNDVFTMSSFRGMMGWPEEDDATVAFWEGLTVNGFNIAAAIAAVLAGHLLVDKHGRRPALFIGSLLFALGGGLQTSAQNAAMLISGRVIAGVGVGITSSAGPAFISEVAPEKIRGMLVGIYQNNVCLAIVAAAVLNYGVHDTGFGWRLSLGLQVAMGLLVVLGLFFVCETPRFLESAGRSSDALQVLTRLRAGDREAAQHELKEVQMELETERDAGDATWSEVFTVPFYRNVVIIGCAIQFFQIMTGINAIVSFSGTLFKALGLQGISFSIIPFVAFTAGNALGSFVLVDRAGRRPLLLFGMMAMCATMLVGGVVAVLAQDADTGHIGEAAGFTIVSMIVLYMFSFGISWGFGAWLYISEIMPLRVRGKAVGLCTAMNWGPANVLSAFLTPQMISSPLGPGGTLIFFGCVCLAVIPFVATCVPETKGKTLEELEIEPDSQAQPYHTCDILAP